MDSVIIIASVFLLFVIAIIVIWLVTRGVRDRHAIEHSNPIPQVHLVDKVESHLTDTSISQETSLAGLPETVYKKDSIQPGRAQELLPTNTEHNLSNIEIQTVVISFLPEPVALSQIPTKTELTSLEKEVISPIPTNIEIASSVSAGNIKEILPEEPSNISNQNVLPETIEVPIGHKNEKVKQVTPRKKVPVENRPPRRGLRRYSKQQNDAEFQEEEAKDPSPEIICWRRGRQWFIALDIASSNICNFDLQIIQGEHALKPDEHREQCFLLDNLSQDINVTWFDRDITHEVDIPVAEFLLFKLSGSLENEGRAVHHACRGAYLLLAPSNWSRDERVCGPIQVSPEASSIPGYIVNYLFLDGFRDKAVVLNEEGDNKPVLSQAGPTFELRGNRLTALDDAMPCFGAGLPEIFTHNPDDWQYISSIVLGEEGSGKNKWRESFQPQTGLTAQPLPSGRVDKQGGWYYLRLYNRDIILVESLDFKMLPSITNISLSDSNLIPPANGYSPVTLRFAHTSDCIIQPVSGISAELNFDQQDTTTTAILPPREELDSTHWSIGANDGHPLVVAVTLKHIWWSLGQASAEPKEWKDKPIQLEKDDFKVYSRQAIWLKLSQKRLIDQVFVGFDRERAQAYLMPVDASVMAIPLINLSDAVELTAPGVFTIKLWLDSQMMTLGNLTLKLRCAICSHPAENRPDMLDHIAQEHLDVFRRSPPWEEIQELLRDRFPDLPRFIYLCGYNDNYYACDDIKEDALHNIVEHIHQRHSNHAGPEIIKFYSITKQEQIHDTIFMNNLPYIIGCKCTNCTWTKETLEEPSSPHASTFLLHHLDEVHRHLLYELA